MHEANGRRAGRPLSNQRIQIRAGSEGNCQTARGQTSRFGGLDRGCCIVQIKMVSGQMTWVVAYDVRQNRRRARVARLLEFKGIRLQKSVFLVEGHARGVRRLVSELAAVVDGKTDTVCAWPLVDAWQARQMCFPPEAAPLQQTFVVA